MLLEKYLKEDFHFTAYNTISYIRKGPKVPKKEDDILFHGARVLKLPEYDAVWNGNTSEPSVTEGSTTPISRNQSAKRRKTDSTPKEGSAKRAKNKPAASSSVTTPKNGNASRSSSVTTPKRTSVSNGSTVKSPKSASTSKKVTKTASTSESRPSARQTDAKPTKEGTPLVKLASDDVIYIPEDQNIIEILD